MGKEVELYKTDGRFDESGFIQFRARDQLRKTRARRYFRFKETKL